MSWFIPLAIGAAAILSACSDSEGADNPDSNPPPLDEDTGADTYDANNTSNNGSAGSASDPITEEGLVMTKVGSMQEFEPSDDVSVATGIVGDDEQNPQPVADEPVVDPVDHFITIERISVGPKGVEANKSSRMPAISGDGQFVAFSSNATNFIAGGNDRYDAIFVRDRIAQITEQVGNTVPGDSAWDPSISADGRYVAYERGNNIYATDRESGIEQLVSVRLDGEPANHWSAVPAISGDGRFVAFSTGGTNLVPNQTNADFGIFVRDLVLGATEFVSLETGGIPSTNRNSGVAINADGRFVAFTSWIDTTPVSDAFVRDRLTRDFIEQVSVSPLGDDGNNRTWETAISSNGRYVAFSSNSSNLVPNDMNDARDIFVYDRLYNVTERVSVASEGIVGNDDSRQPSMSGDGRFVAYTSLANNLVPGDTNETWDIFVHDRMTGATERISIDRAGLEANDWSESPSISADAKFVAFEATASNLVPGDTNDAIDIFVVGLVSFFDI